MDYVLWLTLLVAIVLAIIPGRAMRSGTGPRERMSQAWRETELRTRVKVHG